MRWRHENYAKLDGTGCRTYQLDTAAHSRGVCLPLRTVFAIWEAPEKGGTTCVIGTCTGFMSSLRRRRRVKIGLRGILAPYFGRCARQGLFFASRRPKIAP